MNYLALPSLMLKTASLGILILLTSCTKTNRTPITSPPKVFQYSYQEPSRQLENPHIAQKLSKGRVGETINIKLSNGRASSVRLGNNYFSANGHQCRKYTTKTATVKTACKINNRWYQSRPILINK